MFPPLRLREAMSLGGLSARELVVRTWKKMGEHEIMTRASGISFYAMLAFVPFLALVITLAVQLLPDLSVRPGAREAAGTLTVGELEETLRGLFPEEAYSVLHAQILRIQEQPPVGLLSIGLAITLWTASSLYLAVIDSMNVIYGVTESRPFWQLRLKAIFMTVIQAVILISSLLIVVAWPWIAPRIGLKGSQAIVAELIQFGVVYLMILSSFALAFYVGPDADQRWEWITPGSLIGAGVFLAASYMFRLYIQNFGSYDQMYGSLGGMMVLLFWFWISSVVMLAAGQVNKVIEDASPLGKSFGQKKEPTEAPDFSAMPIEPARESPGEVRG